MSCLAEVAGPRSDPHDNHIVSSGFQDDEPGSHGNKERKLSEKIAQFMKGIMCLMKLFGIDCMTLEFGHVDHTKDLSLSDATGFFRPTSIVSGQLKSNGDVSGLVVVKDIDDVLDTWTESSCNKIVVKLSSKEIACLQNIEASALDEVLLDMDTKKLTSFSSYMSLSDSVMRERLVVSMVPRQVHRPPRGASECGEYGQAAADISHRGNSNNADDLNVSSQNEGFTLNPTSTSIKMADRGEPSSMFGFLKWRKSSESNLSRGNSSRQRSLDTPACSPNIMNYRQRRNSDTGLKGRDLSKLRKHENGRNKNSPTGSTSEISQLFKKLTRRVSETHGLKRNNSLDTCSLTDGSSKDGCLTSSKSINVGNLEFAEEDEANEQNRNAKDYKTRYSSAPNVSSVGNNENTNLFNSEHEMTSNLRLGSAQPSMIRSGSLQVLNFFRNILPDDKTRTAQPLSLPRRHSIDSQLISNLIPRFERDDITLGKRTIKLNRPDHSNAMYLSAADTLGGLPEDEEIQFPPRHPRAKRNFLSENVHEYLTNGRRASCPVIVETTESDEFISSRRFCLLSVKSKARDFLSENSEIEESEETVHSLDKTADRNSRHCKTMQHSDKCDPDFPDSDQSTESFSEAVESVAPTLLGGVTFIVDKRSRLRDGQLTLGTSGDRCNSSDGSSYDGQSANSKSPDENTSSNEELNRRRKKVLKKKNTKQRVKNTHSTGTSTSEVHNCPRSSKMIDNTSVTSTEEANSFRKENGLQVEGTLNGHNNNSLVWNDSSISISSLVREHESSSYFSDISDI